MFAQLRDEAYVKLLAAAVDQDCPQGNRVNAWSLIVLLVNSCQPSVKVEPYIVSAAFKAAVGLSDEVCTQRMFCLCWYTGVCSCVF